MVSADYFLTLVGLIIVLTDFIVLSLLGSSPLFAMRSPCQDTHFQVVGWHSKSYQDTERLSSCLLIYGIRHFLFNAALLLVLDSIRAKSAKDSTSLKENLSYIKAAESQLASDQGWKVSARVVVIRIFLKSLQAP
jgi:hypothetical protein